MTAATGLDDDSSPAVRSDLITATIDDELVIFDPVGSTVHQLDPLGAVIWQFLDGSSTISALVEDLADGFGAPPATVRADLDQLLEKLDSEHLLESSAPDDRWTPPDPPERPEYLKDPPAP